MRIEIRAPMPTDTLHEKQGFYAPWGNLLIKEWDGAPWDWQPDARIMNTDTFWGYRREYRERPVTLENYSGLSIVMLTPKGKLRLWKNTLLLFSDRPTSRLAMALWPFAGFGRNEVPSFGTTGDGVFTRGDTVTWGNEDGRWAPTSTESTDGDSSHLHWTMLS